MVELIDHAEVSIFSQLVRLLHLVVQSVIADGNRITGGQVRTNYLHVSLVVNQFSLLSRTLNVSELSSTASVTSCDEERASECHEAATNYFHSSLHHDVVEHT